MRRHLWWSLVAIDEQIAYASGLPPMIEPKLYHVAVATECIELSTARAPLQNDVLCPSVPGAFLAAKYTFYSYSSEFLRILHANRIERLQVQKLTRIVIELEKEMAERGRQIHLLEQVAISLPSTPLTNAARQVSAQNSMFANFAIIILTMLAAKPYPIMYGPLRHHGLLETFPIPKSK